MEINAQNDIIYLKRLAYDKIINHCFKDLPLEACGYLAGKERCIEWAIPMQNTQSSPERFAFSPEEQFEVQEKVLLRGLKIIGNYHSHPEGKPYPSATDISLAYDPDTLYAIVAWKNNFPDLRLYSIKSGQVKDCLLKIV